MKPILMVRPLASAAPQKGSTQLKVARISRSAVPLFASLAWAQIIYKPIPHDAVRIDFRKPEELIGVAVLPACDAAGFLTGQCITADGGFLASGVNQ